LSSKSKEEINECREWNVEEDMEDKEEMGEAAEVEEEGSDDEKECGVRLDTFNDALIF
jgi:hypothetical protein